MGTATPIAMKSIIERALAGRQKERCTFRTNSICTASRGALEESLKDQRRGSSDMFIKRAWGSVAAIAMLSAIEVARDR